MDPWVVAILAILGAGWFVMGLFLGINAVVSANDGQSTIRLHLTFAGWLLGWPFAFAYVAMQAWWHPAPDG